jgi:transcriptional regulator with XRE-family HTH domain
LGIRERRKALGMTRKELADHIGVATETVARYERHERELRSSIILKLSQALKCEATALLTDENPTPPSTKARPPGARAKRKAVREAAKNA